MCGVIGVFSCGEANKLLYDGLTLLQHRGQDATGISTCHNGKILMRKSLGLVRDVFRTEHMLRLQGNFGVGHVRYPTAGCSSPDETQPFYVNSPYGITMAHNGNLTNNEALQEALFESDFRHINTTSDSEVLLNVFAHELQKNIDSNQLKPDDIFAAVRGVHKRCNGGYVAVGMIAGRGIFAFRDRWGIRPAVIGKRLTEKGEEEHIIRLGKRGIRGARIYQGSRPTAGRSYLYRHQRPYPQPMLCGRHHPHPVHL